MLVTIFPIDYYSISHTGKIQNLGLREHLIGNIIEIKDRGIPH